MSRLLTKEDRSKVMQAIHESRIAKGYTLETYKGLKIYTQHREEMKRYFLEIYRDQSTKPILNYYYTEATHGQMLARIQTTKDGYDRMQTWKTERKESNKGKRLTGSAACADAIREELKKIFPTVKFSVRSETFSMGDAVRIGWTDGPTTKQVDELTGKYQDGYFDGMQDMYIYNKEGDGPSAKYITTSRSMSEETGDAIKADAERFYQADFFGCRDVSQFIYQIFSASPLPTGAKVTGLEETGATSGSYPHEVYRIRFEQTEQAQKVEKPAPVEVPADEVQVIEYSDKSIAVIGNTYPIKEKLKAAGGKFNKFLTCGAGWIFPKSKLEELQKALNQDEESDNAELQAVVTQNNEETTLKDEIQKTVDFFVETDLKLYGEVTEGTKEAANVQNVDWRKHPELEHAHPLNICDPAGGQYKQALKEYEEEQEAAKLQEVTHKTYSTLKDITEAAESGEVISLMNLFDLVNKKEVANV